MSEKLDDITEQLEDELDEDSEELNEEYVQTAGQSALDIQGQLDEDIVDVETLEIAQNIYKYLNHNVDPDSAERTILRNLANENDAEINEILSESGGNEEVEDVKVEEIDEPNEFVNIEVQVSDIWDNDTDVLSQVGLAHDETGKIKFQTWEKSQKPLLTEGQAYRLERVATDEYQGNMSVSINSNTSVEMIDREIEEPDNSEEFTGALVDLRRGSGLIKRCTEGDCNRTLDNGTCSEHGDVEGDFDLRIKGVLDNGETTKDIILSREYTEEITGIRLEEAEQMAKDALDTEVVVEEMASEVMLHYYSVEGWVGDNGDLIAQEINEVTDSPYEVSDLTERLTALESGHNQADITQGDQE